MAWTYGDSERLERVRQRAARQKRIAALSVVALVILLLGGGWWLAVDSAPSPPSIAVSWPSPEKFGTRVFNVERPAKVDILAATLIARKGQPFSIQVGASPMSDGASSTEKSNEAQNWTIHAVSEDTDNTGSSLRWAPSKSDAQLKIFCRPVAHGVYRLVAWLWPTYILRLRALTPETSWDGRSQLKTAESNVWVSSEVVLNGEVSWDDRVIPLLQAAHKTSGARNASAGAGSSPARWLLINGFNGAAGKRAANDTATYAFLDRASDSNKEETDEGDVQAATRLARFFAGRVPTASLKFVASNVGQGQARMVFRFSFDGKAARGGWIKRASETQATPLQWWDAQLGEVAEHGTEPLVPSLPRSR